MHTWAKGHTVKQHGTRLGLLPLVTELLRAAAWHQTWPHRAWIKAPGTVPTYEHEKRGFQAARVSPFSFLSLVS